MGLSDRIAQRRENRGEQGKERYDKDTDCEEYQEDPPSIYSRFELWFDVFHHGLRVGLCPTGVESDKIDKESQVKLANTGGKRPEAFSFSSIGFEVSPTLRSILNFKAGPRIAHHLCRKWNDRETHLGNPFMTPSG